MAKLYGMTNCGTQNWNYNSKNNYEDFEVEREELETGFKKPKSGKALGEDNIPSELCKYASDTLKTRAIKFLNEIYVSGTIPAEWNSVVVTPVYNKGDMKAPDNYRGINFLNSCYKIYTKKLNEKLKKYSETCLDDTQSDFKKG
jgi:hypothetical protein